MKAITPSFASCWASPLYAVRLGQQAAGGLGDYFPAPDATDEGAVVLLAGRVAVQHFNPNLTRDFESGASLDVQHVLDSMFRRYGRDRVATHFSRADRHARQLVAWHWQAIERVAQALIRAGRLSGDDVRRIRFEMKLNPVALVTLLTHMSRKVKEIIRAAGLRDELTFTSFRHGGFTEAGDADLTDAQIRAQGGHKSAKVLPKYVKRTQRQIATGAKKRRAQRTAGEHLPE